MEYSSADTDDDNDMPVIVVTDIDQAEHRRTRLHSFSSQTNRGDDYEGKKTSRDGALSVLSGPR